MEDTLVFIPAWNEAASLPDVLSETRRDLPDADVLVVDDGSTDDTAEVAKAGGALVVGFPENRGLRHGIAEGYRQALDRGYAFCGRLDADGQHPAGELARMLAMVKAGECDVAVGSRFVSGDGYEAGRYQPSPARVVGTSLLRQGMRHVLGRPFADATSGMYAVNAKAMPILAEPYATGAPEVEGLLRLRDAGLVVKELPVNMRERASGESKLAGKKALLLVLTVIGTLFAYRRVRGR
jgi:glycosyltransferase involved in cell wall biosynthesis